MTFFTRALHHVVDEHFASDGCVVGVASFRQMSYNVPLSSNMQSFLDELVEAEDYVVWLHRRVGHLGRRNDREGLHDAIGVSLTDLRNQKRSHIGASSTTERVAQLETLEVIAAFRLLPHHIQHRVDELRCEYQELTYSQHLEARATMQVVLPRTRWARWSCPGTAGRSTACPSS